MVVGEATLAADIASRQLGRIAAMGGVVNLSWLVILVLTVWRLYVGAAAGRPRPTARALSRPVRRDQDFDVFVVISTQPVQQAVVPCRT
jgi:hypothetical protein